MDAFLEAFLLLYVLVTVPWLGYQLAVGKLRDDRAAVEQQRVALQAEWQQLDASRRVRSIFLSARRAMQAEAVRSAWPSYDDDQEAGQ
jgi:hypothetical protein